jgi:redox-sensing transcriptional repressor
MLKKVVPDVIVSRLPVYLRALQFLHLEGVQNTSSLELGGKVNISAAQIRKDLSQFGEFGKQGTGYNVEALIDHLQTILQVGSIWDVMVIGMGDMGHALVRYNGFRDRGFRISDCFDNDPNKIGNKVGDYIIKDVTYIPTIDNVSRKMVMLCVPAKAAQVITNILVEIGIKAILNYAPVHLSVPSDVKVQYIDPVIGLQRMAYYLNQNEDAS